MSLLIGVSKAPFASPQKPLGTRQGRWSGSTALPGTFGCTCLHRSLACQSRCMSLLIGVSKAPFASPQKPLGTQQGRWPGSTALPGTFGCTCLHRSLACQSRCMSLLKGVSKAPFASPQKPLGTRQGRWPGSTALPGTFGCTCLRRSLACQSRCMSLLILIGVSKAPFASPQKPLGSQQALARLHSPSRDLWLHMPAPQPCLPKPAHVTPYRRFESAVCQPSKASRDPAGPLARLHSPSRDLWLHMPALKSLSGPSRAVGQCHSL